MTYAMAWPLQQGLFATLCNSELCEQHFNGQIFDAPLPFGNEAAPEGLYLIIGDEEVQDWSTGSDQGAVHLISLNIHAPRRGFAEAKQAAADISDTLLTSEIALSRGRVINIRFVDASTHREEADQLRRIEMRFRVTLEDTA